MQGSVFLKIQFREGQLEGGWAVVMLDLMALSPSGPGGWGDQPLYLPRRKWEIVRELAVGRAWRQHTSHLPTFLRRCSWSPLSWQRGHETMCPEIRGANSQMSHSRGGGDLSKNCKYHCVLHGDNKQGQE